jgi:tetratricopeptide (TPR) repeat protein
VPEALPLLERALEQTIAMRLMTLYPPYAVRLGEGYMLAGRVAEAMPLGQRAFEVARAHKLLGHQAYALRLLGAIAVHRYPPEVEPAEDHYQQALALAEELGMRPLQAHCHHGLGALYGRTGRADQARTALATAIDLYRAMDMTFYLTQAEAALADIRPR